MILRNVSLCIMQKHPYIITLMIIFDLSSSHAEISVLDAVQKRLTSSNFIRNFNEMLSKSNWNCRILLEILMRNLGLLRKIKSAWLWTWLTIKLMKMTTTNSHSFGGDWHHRHGSSSHHHQNNDIGSGNNNKDNHSRPNEFPAFVCA